MKSVKLRILEIGGDCAGCFALSPVLREVAAKFALPVEKADVSSASERGISLARVPAVVLLREERPFAVCYGYQPEEILSLWLEEKIKEANEEIG